jgi:hypothetical protein
VLEYALSLARDLAHSWPSWPPSILSVCNSSISDWGKKVADALSGLISANRFRSHVVSRDALKAVTYLISHVDSATIGCLLDSQAISILAPRNRYPLVDLQVDISPA